MTLNEALGIVRLMIDRGISRETAIENQVIPGEFRAQIREIIIQEENITLEPVRMLVSGQPRDEWLRHVDRSDWYYWPTLREYLLGVKGWSIIDVRLLDEATDRILGQLARTETDQFDIRGLVLGYVQSGKTANYTALIAKAADVGYRLVVVLSGIDNGLRRQTQIRLKRELSGYVDNRSGSVRLPPLGHQWHEFTREEIGGDFRPGYANHAALQGSQPVLLVVKKNGPVLRRLLRWLDEAPEEVRRMIPLLLIDDEADQASVDTRGTYQIEDETLPDDYEAPSVINSLIRDLLRRFQRSVYVAYTATPFANILIPHDTFDPQVENDLYPKDFIMDLGKPEGYFGTEELFGRFDPIHDEHVVGLDVIRDVPDEDMHSLEQGELPPSIENAMIDFVLAGAARSQRGHGSLPATMLLHISHLVVEQQRVATLVWQRLSELRDEWRYQRRHGIRDRLQMRWETEFRPVTRASHLERDVVFEQVESHIGPFFEAVQVKAINSATGEVLDYENEPALKAIAVGGNRLSRGLTLEGLLISYFVRRSVAYDTLMQMGRWFGYRSGYDDLTRIYTTAELAGWFNDLAFVEHRLREDLEIYENQGLTPYQVGMRIWQHPTMQVTSPLKRRFASATTISQSYSGQLEQTFKFPLSRPDALVIQAEQNLLTVQNFLGGLGVPQWEEKGPVWSGILSNSILTFLRGYSVDEQARSISPSLVCAYIERQVEVGELTRWTVAVRGRQNQDTIMGEAPWRISGGHIWQISRTRLRDTDSVGVITSPGDERVGLSPDAEDRMLRYREQGLTENLAARRARLPQEGLLMLYPISRFSGYDLQPGGIRRPLYDNPNDPLSRDLIGLAISFPQSSNMHPVEAYLEGTVGWRPVE
ncbi:MAG TPA: Z1 domain-containing protein [Syntrophorhabdaceae bacterium]|nr:Z1 domain-containing protein [Syntrophorhabdaceae bacterium]